MRRSWLILVGLCGCSINQSGFGSTTGGGEDDNATPPASSTAGTGTPDTGMMTSSMSNGTTNSTSTPAPTATSTSTSTDPDDGTSETTTSPTCPPPEPFGQILMAEDAIIEAPATLVPSWGDLNGSPQVAYSLESDAGVMHFDFEVPCDGTYYAWGLVWDRWSGTGLSCGGPINPDSAVVFPDDNQVAGRRWVWGCTSCKLADAVWFWDRIDEFEAIGCDVDDIDYEWAAGSHRISFLNEDAGTPAMGMEPPDAAAIAAVVISDDPDFDPATLYAP